MHVNNPTATPAESHRTFLPAPTRLAAMTTCFLRLLAFGICGVLLMAPGVAHAALNQRDIDTQSLERKVADDPRAALTEGEALQQQALKSGDKKLQTRALRLMVLANAELEQGILLAKQAEQGLALAQEIDDKQAECEFLAARASAKATSGSYVAAIEEFDAAIAVAEKADLTRAATSVMVAKAFVYGLLGRDTDSLDLLFKAHQRFVEMDDKFSARSTISAIGTAYTHDRASREDLAKALGYHQQAIAVDAEQHSRHELATIYFNIGAVYQRLKDWPNASLFVQKSIALYRALNDPMGVAFGNYRLAVLASESGKWNDALLQLDSVLPLMIDAGDVTMVFNVQRARAKALANLDRRKESLDALAKAAGLRARIESLWIETHYLRTAAEVYARLGDFEKAYRQQVLLLDAETRSVSEAREKDAADAQTRFEVKQKETENALLRARERANNARNLALVLALVVLLIVLGGLGWYLFRQGQQNRRFANLALRDDLTGLPNRRSILEYARVQLRESRLGSARMCLALIDIDHFKSFNDQFGHAAGDAVLTAFAETCAQQLRSDDKIGRYGGEEFLLIMPGSDLSQVPQVFARLRDAIFRTNVPGLAIGHPLTFSMGAVDVIGSIDDIDKLIKRADEALYRAKLGGRDRFELAT